MIIYFFRAETAPERAAINHFLRRHNQRGQGSITGYVATYAAAHHEPERPLLARLVAAAKFCPLHTPQAAKFFAGEAWRHVYGFQRLAAYRAPKHRYCWAVGPPLKRLFRRRALRQRMAQFQFEPIYQPRLLVRLQPSRAYLGKLGGVTCGLFSG